MKLYLLFIFGLLMIVVGMFGMGETGLHSFDPNWELFYAFRNLSILGIGLWVVMLIVIIYLALTGKLEYQDDENTKAIEQLRKDVDELKEEKKKT